MTEDQIRSGSDRDAAGWQLHQELPEPREAVPLTGEAVLGRGQQCDIVLASSRASRRHAKLSLEDGKLIVEDLGSANGTYVNGDKIDRAELVNGDRLSFDEIVFVVSGPEPDPAEQATVVEPIPALQPAPEPEPPPPVPDPAPGRQWWDRPEQGPEGTILEQRPPEQRLAADGTIIAQGAAASADRPSLVCVSEPYIGEVFALDAEGSVIGRDPGSDIVLDDSAVSVKHARVSCDDGAWKLVDLMSANGTFVQGRKVQTAFLSPGDRIELGRIELRFVENSEQGTRYIRQLQLDQPLPATTAGAAGKTPPAWLLMLIGFAVVLAAGAVYLLWFR